MINGYEVGGGSIRIHNYDLQMWILKDCLKLSQIEIESFSTLLNGLRCGCPPHGGFALGLDRFLAVLLNKNSIRDVIAFPKTSQGRELMTDCPNVLRDEVKMYYNIK